ncbi:uncharacterized protein LOC142323877 isoform X2 [Lycorma delicatula]|uniref:uncharacterized protein LOC142323877 isoform X2 n=1 Tax=Lycorma delicatula TaxID=130591 RepID=UPI003F512CB3
MAETVQKDRRKIKLEAKKEEQEQEKEIQERIDNEYENDYNDDDDDDDDDDEEQSPWVNLPDLIIEKVYDYLSMRERYYASMVCQSWNRAFYLSYSWATFVFDETTLTRRRFNYYSGWQYILDHLRTQQCLSTVGRNLRVLLFKPMTNFYNLYEFMNMISYYMELQGTDNWTIAGVGGNIHTLQYVFPCSMQARDESERARLYGTGGKLLAALKRLMTNLSPSLRHLELIDLMLDSSEALHLLDQVCYDCTLAISPQNLGDDVVYLLSETRLKNLDIIQNRYTPLDIPPVNPKTWRDCRKKNNKLAVHLKVESKRDRQLLWQEEAPVHTVIYSSPECKLQAETISRCVDLYGPDLEVFGHLGLPRYYQPESFDERHDLSLLLLCQMCPNLRTLVIRERVSTATVLLIASTGKNLKNYYVRRNAVILRSDWPKNQDWSHDFYIWLKMTSRSYEKTEQEVSMLLGYRWTMLTDKEFKRILPSVFYQTG